MNKTKFITGALTLTPNMDTKELADKAGCTTALVNHVRRGMKRVPASKPEIVGVIADTHIPFEHPEYLQHCIDTFKRFGVTKVVHIGDLVDHHAGSRFSSELEAKNVEEELKMTKEALKPWIKAFPELKLCLGNHDKIPARQAKTVGISQSFMKTFEELYELPEGWDCAMSHVIDGVHYDHGCNSGGMMGAKNTSLKMGVSYVQGHTHMHAGVYYNANVHGKTTFGLNVGCGINQEAYAYNYARGMRGELVMGCGIVMEGKDALFIAMK
jgi:predicted phosphodiesterase